MSKNNENDMKVDLSEVDPAIAQEVANELQVNLEKPKRNPNPYNRKLTNEDILKYEPMVEKYMRDSVKKNWNEAKMGKNQDIVALGNTGMSMEDIRQQLRAEVCVALYNYNPDYRTKEGRSVKESTFVFGHLFNRCGQLMKRLTKQGQGYGVWHSNIEETLWETDRGD